MYSRYGFPSALPPLAGKPTFSTPIPLRRRQANGDPTRKRGEWVSRIYREGEGLSVRQLCGRCVGPGYDKDQRCADLRYCLRIGYSGEVGSAILNSGGKFIVAELVSVISFHKPVDRIENENINVAHDQLPFLWR